MTEADSEIIKPEESNELDSVCSNSSLHGKLLTNVCHETKLLEIEDDGLAAEDEFDDCDLDDDIDPALKEKIDRHLTPEYRLLTSGGEYLEAGNVATVLASLTLSRARGRNGCSKPIKFDNLRVSGYKREVEDFARRLNSDWPERMQEILSLGQEKRPLRLTINGNGSLRR
ncbi:UNVERIFIED_CONTAM: hypothetical protein Sradi_1135700 [Sesamum radiatum]|uniref:Uncharacterized protein n=1 Tax=Sesamum radiatum TaxID=300843 RepID=A0AAW2V8E6_SESRA